MSDFRDQPVMVEVPLSGFEAYWHACTGTPYEPTYVPLVVDQYAPLGSVYLDAFDKKLALDGLLKADKRYAPANYFFNHELWTRWLETERHRPLTPLFQGRKHERRQYGARSVRQWFREMRAADFEAECRLRVSLRGLLYHATDSAWTLFDTLQVVDRETARTYLSVSDDLFEFPILLAPEFPFNVIGFGPMRRVTLDPARRARLNYGDWE